MFLVTERLGYSVGVDEEGAPIEAYRPSPFYLPLIRLTAVAWFLSSVISVFDVLIRRKRAIRRLDEIGESAGEDPCRIDTKPTRGLPPGMLPPNGGGYRARGHAPYPDMSKLPKPPKPVPSDEGP